MRRDIEHTRALEARLRAGRASAGDQQIAADFVNAWLARIEREQLERAGQLVLIP